MCISIRRGVWAASCAVSSVVLGAGAEVPSEWSFELQARSTLDSSLPGFNLPFPSSLSSQQVAIDEDGGVAIRVILGGQEGIFYGRDSEGAVVVSRAAGADPVWSSSLDLRNGLIGIEQGSFNDGAELYDTDGNLVREFAIGGSQGVSGFSGLSITGDGAMCYRGDFGFVSEKVVIDEFVGGDRMQTLVAETGAAYSFLFSPAINDARQVVMNTIPTDGTSRRILRFEADGSPTTVAETGPVFNAFVNSTGIAQSGHVAYSGRRSAGSIWAVNRWDGSSTTTIVDGNNADIVNGSIANFPPAVNSEGLVAVRATDTSNASTALWVGDGAELVKLVEYDQVIETDLGPLPLGFDFGGDVGRQVMNGRVDINDAGQVAFAAFLRNGTIGVFVATPTDKDGCIADFNGDGVLDFFDISSFVNAFQGGDPGADLNGDGNLDFFDVSQFLNSFNVGCP